MRDGRKYLWAGIGIITLTLTGWLTSQGGGAVSGASGTTKAGSITSDHDSDQGAEVPTGTGSPLSVDTSQMTVDSGKLSNLIKSQAVNHHVFPGTHDAEAQVLASVDGDGTLVVAGNVFGDELTNQRSTLYFLSPKKRITQITSLPHGGEIISEAVLSQRWIAWTVFIPNGVMANIGVLDRETGHSWYAGSTANEYTFMQKGLSEKLFVRGNFLYAYSSEHVYRYDMAERQWSTFYSAPVNQSMLGFELVPEGEVVELDSDNGRGQSKVIQLDPHGNQIGPTYVLPKDVLYLTGSSANKVVFAGNSESTYCWTVGSPSVARVSNVSSWLSGDGGRYLAGWGYASKPAGQLLDMETKQRYEFDADSAVVTPTTLYWTTGNAMYWTALPK